ncbi:MAG: hypothetical protein COA69_10950 [Robiginitomaculum sp.]|nr:MAG: hypothetical protein COA69_10950 [Robiginitomaculum sp.]
MKLFPQNFSLYIGARLKGIALVLMVCVSACSSSAPDPFEDGVQAYHAQEHTQDFQLFRDAAEAGHAEAQFNLGALYADGTGVPKSYKQAMV